MTTKQPGDSGTTPIAWSSGGATPDISASVRLGQDIEVQRTVSLIVLDDLTTVENVPDLGYYNDTGGYFDLTSGIFTAPFRGKYQASANINARIGNGVFESNGTVSLLLVKTPANRPTAALLVGFASFTKGQLSSDGSFTIGYASYTGDVLLNRGDSLAFGVVVTNRAAGPSDNPRVTIIGGSSSFIASTISIRLFTLLPYCVCPCPPPRSASLALPDETSSSGTKKTKDKSREPPTSVRTLSPTVVHYNWQTKQFSGDLRA